MKKNRKSGRWGIGLCISLVLILMGCGQTNEKELPIDPAKNKQVTPEKIETKKEAEVQEPQKKSDKVIYVQLCGAVTKPGIYSCEEGDYLFSIIEKAGGLLESACFESVNQAQIVVDGQMIVVYSKEEFSSMKTISGKMNSEGYDETTKVNINIADAAKLMTLPGIGEAKAAQIIQYRENKGLFKKIEDIMNIGGIKERLFETIKDAICVN